MRMVDVMRLLWCINLNDHQKNRLGVYCGYIFGSVQPDIVNVLIS